MKNTTFETLYMTLPALFYQFNATLLNIYIYIYIYILITMLSWFSENGTHGGWDVYFMFCMVNLIYALLGWQNWLLLGFIDHSELFWKRASESIVLMEYKVCAPMEDCPIMSTAILHIPHSDDISRGDTSDIKTSILLTYQGQITLEAIMQWLNFIHQPESDESEAWDPLKPARHIPNYLLWE